MTITSDVEFQHTQQRVAEFERSLAQVRRRLSNEPASLTAITVMYERQLDELRKEIAAYIGASPLATAAVELRFESSDGVAGIPTLSALESVVGNFRVALATLADAILGHTRETGRPRAETARSVDMRLVGIAPGSVRLLLEYPPQQALDESLPERAMKLLEDASEWIASTGERPPSLEDSDLALLALRQVQRLSPSEGSELNWVEIARRGRPAEVPVRFDRSSFRGASLLLESTIARRTISVTGKLREVDLDKRSFELRPTTGRRQHCVMPDDVLREVLDYIARQQTVIVRGTMTKRPRQRAVLKVVTVEPVRDEA